MATSGPIRDFIHERKTRNYFEQSKSSFKMLQEYKYKKMISELGKDPSDLNSPKTDINRGR